MIIVLYDFVGKRFTLDFFRGKHIHVWTFKSGNSKKKNLIPAHKVQDKSKSTFYIDSVFCHFSHMWSIKSILASSKLIIKILWKYLYLWFRFVCTCVNSVLISCPMNTSADPSFRYTSFLWKEKLLQRYIIAQSENFIPI